jgi:hypothetical protein
MGRLADSLREYFKTTPKEQLDKDWEEIKPLNDIGPIVVTDDDDQYDAVVDKLNKVFDELYEQYFSDCARIRIAAKQAISIKIIELGKKKRKGKKCIYTYTPISYIYLSVCVVTKIELYEYDGVSGIRIYRNTSDAYELSDLDIMDIKVIIDYFYPNETK